MKWNIEKKYIRVGIISLCVIILAILFNYTLQNNKEMEELKATIQGTMAPIVMGCILAYLLTPFLHFFEDYCFNPLGKLIYRKDSHKVQRMKFSRGMSILCTIVLLAIVVAGGLYLVIPQVYQSLVNIVTDAPTYYASIQKWMNSLDTGNSEINSYFITAFDRIYSQAIAYMNEHILPNMDKIVVSVTSGIVGGIKLIFNVFLSLIISIYVMAEKENLISVFKKLVYCIFNVDYANSVIQGIRYAGKVFGGFVNGKLIDSFIIGGICYVFMVIVGFEYPVLISIVIGITNIIPYFGPFIGGIPSVLILLMVNPKHGIIFGLFVIILQQVDGNIIGPIVLGDRLKLSSMWILLSILIGGGFFGVLGMILGAPCFACIYTLISTISKKNLEKKQLPTDTELYYEVESIRMENGNCIVVRQPINNMQNDMKKKKNKKEVPAKQEQSKEND